MVADMSSEIYKFLEFIMEFLNWVNEEQTTWLKHVKFTYKEICLAKPTQDVLLPGYLTLMLFLEL